MEINKSVTHERTRLIFQATDQDIAKRCLNEMGLPRITPSKDFAARIVRLLAGNQSAIGHIAGEPQGYFTINNAHISARDIEQLALDFAEAGAPHHAAQLLAAIAGFNVFSLEDRQHALTCCIEALNQGAKLGQDQATAVGALVLAHTNYGDLKKPARSVMKPWLLQQNMNDFKLAAATPSQDLALEKIKRLEQRYIDKYQRDTALHQMKKLLVTAARAGDLQILDKATTALERWAYVEHGGPALQLLRRCRKKLECLPTVALYYAVHDGDEIKVAALLVDPKLDVNRGHPESPLARAVTMGSFKIAQALINSGRIVCDNKGEHDGISLLGSTNELDMVKLLLSLPGIDPNKYGIGDYSPLATSLLFHNRDVTRALLSAGADPNQRSGPDQGTPLEIFDNPLLTTLPDPEIRKLLVSKGAETPVCLIQ
jgi:hypothetical protein